MRLLVAACLWLAGGTLAVPLSERDGSSIVDGSAGHGLQLRSTPSVSLNPTVARHLLAPRSFAEVYAAMQTAINLLNAVPEEYKAVITAAIPGGLTLWSLCRLYQRRGPASAREVCNDLALAVSAGWVTIGVTLRQAHEAGLLDGFTGRNAIATPTRTTERKRGLAKDSEGRAGPEGSDLAARRLEDGMRRRGLAVDTVVVEKRASAGAHSTTTSSGLRGLRWRGMDGVSDQHIEMRGDGGAGVVSIAPPGGGVKRSKEQATLALEYRVLKLDATVVMEEEGFERLGDRMFMACAKYAETHHHVSGLAGYADLGGEMMIEWKLSAHNGDQDKDEQKEEKLSEVVFL